MHIWPDQQEQLEVNLNRLSASETYWFNGFNFFLENLCLAAARGSLKRLISYRLAGANLSQSDFSGRSALHVACLHGHKEVVEYLLNNNVDKNVKDLLNFTPFDYAVHGDQTEIKNLLIENGVEQTKYSKSHTDIQSI